MVEFEAPELLKRALENIKRKISKFKTDFIHEGRKYAQMFSDSKEIAKNCVENARKR